MATVAEVLEALAGVLSDVTGLRATEFVPELINPPAAFLNVTSIDPDTFGPETLLVSLDGVVLVSRGAGARVGQRSLYDLYKPFTDAIAANDDLGLGDGTQATVGSYRGLGLDELASASYYGGAFAITVTTPT